MKDKINYHLSSLFSELKTIISDEIANSIQQTLISCKSELTEQTQTVLTIEDVASVFKISKSHINKLRKKYKDFPVINIDGSVRFKKNELEEFFKTISAKRE